MGLFDKLGYQALINPSQNEELDVELGYEHRASTGEIQCVQGSVAGAPLRSEATLLLKDLAGIIRASWVEEDFSTVFIIGSHVYDGDEC